MNEAEEIKSRLDIVEVIGQSLPLKKVGRTFKAECPFHQEKTPSFIVSPDRQTWHCFGACATGGDVISFVMKREGMDFPEALRFLADRAGVRLADRRVSAEQDRKRERLYAANEAAAEYYAALLKTDAGRGAAAYLAGRGVDEATVAEFSLGYSLDSWEACRDELNRKGFTDGELLDAGLAIKGERGLYDRFRNRLMFPVWSARGQVIGFGARALGDATPKYLNTAQTNLFDKGGNLYALNKAVEAIRSSTIAVVVEGYMDVIAAHQHGFLNVVAQMGTALTERQYSLLKRVADRVVLVLDADAAGQDAMHKVVTDVAGAERVSADAMAFKERLPVDLQSTGSFYVAALPSGKDPDELIRTDPAAWRDAIERARPYIDFWIEYAAQHADLVTPQGKKAASVEMMQIVRSIDDAVIRAHYLQKVSRLAQVPESELLVLIRGGKRPAREVIRPTGDAPRSSEELLVATLVQYPGVPVPDSLTSDLLTDARAKALTELRMNREQIDSSSRLDDPELTEYVERLIMWKLPISDEHQATEVLMDCVRKLNKQRLQLEQQAIAAQIADIQDGAAGLEPGGGGDSASTSAEIERLVSRDIEIARQLHARRERDEAYPSRVE